MSEVPEKNSDETLIGGLGQPVCQCSSPVFRSDCRGGDIGRFGGRVGDAGGVEVNCVQYGLGDKASSEGAGVTHLDSPEVCDENGVPLGMDGRGGSGNGGDGDGSREGGSASGGVGLHAKARIDRSGLDMTGLIGGVGLGKREGGNSGDSGGNSAMVVSEGISGGMVVVESVLAIVRVFGSHPG